jgi:hypothetical protein
MISIAAWWGLGYAALLVAFVTYGRGALRHRAREDEKSVQWVPWSLSALSTILLWVGLVTRARTGHGWPIVTTADAAAAIGLIALLVHTTWSLVAPKTSAGVAASGLALLALSYGLSRFPQAPVTLSLASRASLLSSGLNVLAAGLLGLAAAYSLTAVFRTRDAQRQGATGPDGAQGRDQISETLVRVALLCLAVGLAVDTWWLQEVGLGREGDAQQAGIAIAWVVYFAALRLRGSARWRGWPWASILTVGFLCTLPILLDAEWLGNTLPI